MWTRADHEGIFSLTPDAADTDSLETRVHLLRQRPGVRAVMTVQHQRTGRRDQPGQGSREGEGALRSLGVRGVLHDEVEALVGGGEALDGDLGLRTEELYAPH